MNRRYFVRQSSITAMGILFSAALNHVFAGKIIPVFLLVSGWQDVNIGYIGHAPGLLQVFKTFIPWTKVILWKKSKG